MNTDDRTVAFINSLDKGNSLFLYELEKYAHATGVPIIRTQTQSLLRFLLTVKKTRTDSGSRNGDRILGTFDE